MTPIIQRLCKRIDKMTEVRKKACTVMSLSGIALRIDRLESPFLPRFQAQINFRLHRHRYHTEPVSSLQETRVSCHIAMKKTKIYQISYHLRQLQ